MIESDYVDFIKTYSTGKTDYYAVQTKSHEAIGVIKWYSRWRRYCFFPDEGTLYDSKCMKNIADFMQSIMDARKIAKEGE